MLAQEQRTLLIGQLARESGISIKTIRYYEELGLITSSGRTEGQYRLFDAKAIARLGFIKTLQKLGLSLQEIAEVLQIYDSGTPPCDDIKAKLEHQLVEIDRHIAELMNLRSELSSLLSTWVPPTVSNLEAICPILHERT